MLLVKYEKFSVLAKDEYLEEILFKYEKNVLLHQKFDQRGRELLSRMIEQIEGVPLKESGNDKLYEELVEL